MDGCVTAVKVTGQDACHPLQGTGAAYQIAAQENVTGTFVAAPAVKTATTPNPETVYFK